MARRSKSDRCRARGSPRREAASPLLRRRRTGRADAGGRDALLAPRRTSEGMKGDERRGMYPSPSPRPGTSSAGRPTREGMPRLSASPARAPWECESPALLRKQGCIPGRTALRRCRSSFASRRIQNNLMLPRYVGMPSSNACSTFRQVAPPTSPEGGRPDAPPPGGDELLPLAAPGEEDPPPPSPAGRDGGRRAAPRSGVGRPGCSPSARRGPAHPSLRRRVAAIALFAFGFGVSCVSSRWMMDVRCCD